MRYFRNAVRPRRFSTRPRRRPKHHSWIAGFAILFSSTACGNNIVLPDILEITVQVEGTITALDTGNPVEGAFLEVRTATTGVQFAETFTDENGLYSFSFIYRFFRGETPFCPFVFFVTAPGFFGETPPLACVEEVQTIDVQLQPD